MSRKVIKLNMTNKQEVPWMPDSHEIGLLISLDVNSKEAMPGMTYVILVLLILNRFFQNITHKVLYSIFSYRK